jgi:predicted Rossmann-fold nucleotide-binding protein
MDVVIDTVALLRAQVPKLTDAWIVGLDLRDVTREWTEIEWTDLDVDGAAFAGCRLSTDDEERLRAAGATVLPPVDGFDFTPYRAALYEHDELMAGYEPGRPDTTLDARIGRGTQVPTSPLEQFARGVHDSCIDAALLRFLEATPGPVVGIMGSHATSRDDPVYRPVADLARNLTRAGFVVATGGGPGLMEAANLGAWLASADDDALDEALADLAKAPEYAIDPAAYLERALDVRAAWPHGATSLGVPTWLYVDEPLNQFSTHIAKYFQNSIRENGLLAIALGGVVYTAGSSGTAQEIFTDAAQNDYTLYGVRSPMVFLGADHYEREHPGLIAAVRDLADRGGWAHLVRVVDTGDAALDAIRELVPPVVEPIAGAPQWRRSPLRKR